MAKAGRRRLSVRPWRGVAIPPAGSSFPRRPPPQAEATGLAGEWRARFARGMAEWRGARKSLVTGAG